MKKLFMKPVIIAIGVLLGLALVFGGVTLVRNLLDPMDCRIAENVTIGGLRVGGMTRREARAALKAAENQTIRNNTLVIQLPEKDLEVDPQEAGFRLSVSKAVRDAYQVGRQTDSAELPLSLYLDYDESYLRGLLESYAARYDTTLTAPEWKVRGQAPALGTDVYDPSASGQTVELTLGLPERRLDVENAIDQILHSLDQGLSGVVAITIEVPCKTEPQKPNLEEIYNTCAIASKNDKLDLESYQIVYGSYGYHFDLEKAQEMVDQADYGETISIPMEAYPPEILGEGVYFRDVLGSCETKHSDDENRNTNLRLVCEFLNGTVIQPGEEFSYNMAVGERTEERGFKSATVFSGNRKSKDIGGGVCQGSTTLYNCLLEADMEVLERHGHGALVTYIPLGLDAAVNWLTETDLRFRNNSHFPVKIQAEVSDGYMKMKLLGTDEKDFYIELEAKSYKEGDYYFATSYSCKYDKETNEQISRDRIAFSSYVADLPG